jgi:hypothetical protein
MSSMQALRNDEVHEVVRAAVRAPSILNTQPWTWRPVPDGLQLRGDSDRLLRVADPAGRMLTVSCGAALFSARIALRHLHRTPIVTLQPDPTDPRLLAHVAVEEGPQPSVEEEWLWLAIPERHSLPLGRASFTDRRLGAGLVRALTAASADEGVGLRVVVPPAAHRLTDVVADAAAASAADPARSAETRSWFGERVRTVVPPDADPTYAVLGTSDDGRAAWLRTGQALQRVLLLSTLAGVSAAFLTEPLEDVRHRRQVGDLVGIERPQVLLRVGFTEGPPPFAGRRPLAEVLEGI